MAQPRGVGNRKRSARILSHNRPYLLGGLVEGDFGDVILTVEEVRIL